MGIERFLQPKSLEEALALLGAEGEKAQVVAGGTDVMVALRNGSLDPRRTCFIDIGRIEGLAGVRTLAGSSGLPVTGLRIVELGSATTHAVLTSDATVRDSSLILGMAAHCVGSPQIRNRGTLGGNIVTAAQCADTIPALLALDAELVLRKAGGGERVVAIRDFFPSPKRTAIAPDELMTAVRYTALSRSEGWLGSYYKLIRRAAVAKARLSFAILVRISAEGVLTDARISIGSTLPTPGRFPTAEALLRGTPVGPLGKSGAPQPAGTGADKGALRERVDAVADACVDYLIQQAGRRWSSEYKEPAVRNVVRRELSVLLGLEAAHD